MKKIIVKLYAINLLIASLGLPSFSQAQVASNWSNPATWGGTLPTTENSVTIPAGKTIVLDTNVDIKNLTINGTLLCAPKRVALSTEWIMVHGKFECGTPSTPFNNRLTVTLRGKPSDPSVMGMGNKLIGVMGGGVLSLHGREVTSWTRLGATAEAGSNVITLMETPKGWWVGHKIVIATSSEDMNHTEVRTIRKISDRTITLNAPLTYGHFGEQLTYTNKNGKTWTTETRAEVGILNRSIVIRGDEESLTTKHGGHVMVMVDSKAYIQGVQFQRMGQEGILGRYPFHWHFVGDGQGQYIRNSSVELSYNRCITVHQTDNTIVENNMCYDHIGHGYFLEDGVEQGNHIIGNLSMVARKAAAGKAILESDNHVGTASEGPGNFWISNPKNIVKNNVAAGGEGTAFWFFMVDQKLNRYDGTTTNPRTGPSSEYVNNIGHGVAMGYSSCSFGGVDGWRSKGINLQDLTVYMTKQTGVWPCSLGTQKFTNMQVLDSSHADGPKQAAYVAPNPNSIVDSLFVANSPLARFNGGKVSRPALGLYDNGSGLYNTHFVGYVAEDKSYLMSNLGGAVKLSKNHMVNVSFDPAQFMAFAKGGDAGPIGIMSGMHDDDQGTVTGIPNTYLAPESSLLEMSACTKSYPNKQTGTSGTVCKMRIIRARFKNLDASVQKNYKFFRRDANGKYTFRDERSNPAIPALQTFTTVNQKFYFGVEFITPPSKSFTVNYGRGHSGDKVHHEIRNVPANLTPQGLRKVSSIEELNTATDEVYFRDGKNLHIQFYLPRNVDNFEAQRNVDFETQ